MFFAKIRLGSLVGRKIRAGKQALRSMSRLLGLGDSHHYLKTSGGTYPIAECPPGEKRGQTLPLACDQAGKSLSKKLISERAPASSRPVQARFMASAWLTAASPC